MNSKLNKHVFFTSSGIIALLALFASIFPKFADSFFKSLQNVIVQNGSWFYVLTVAIILITVFYLALSKYGDIKLGPDHSTSRLFISFMVCYAFFSRDGYWSYVFWCC